MSRLILSRKPSERIRIGDDITIELMDKVRGKSTFCIEAPRHIDIYREEIWERIQLEKKAARNRQNMSEAKA